MYISDVDRKTQKELANFCERNDLTFEIWENPNEPCIATFFIHDDRRLWITATRGIVTIYCSDNNNSDDWIFVDTTDYYQLIW